MADCDRTIADLHLYLADELLPHTHTLVQEHLRACPSCLHAFDFHAELRSVVARKAKEPALPMSLQQRLAETFSLDAPKIFGQVSPFDRPSAF
jgi:anti-sigma factor (TIGR02949 family)